MKKLMLGLILMLSLTGCDEGEKSEPTITSPTETILEETILEETILEEVILYEDVSTYWD